MRLRDLPAYLRDTLLRTFPHRALPGLLRIGNPGRDAPVLLTGNFALTVRRMKDALAGHDLYLLVADSQGINVWCAAGGGHLTHHDMISVIRTSGVADLVDHREIILPQLCATGVERRQITDATGFATRWGPARLEDLPAFLDRGCHAHRGDRTMRFPLWERMEMAVMWGAPVLAIGSLVVVPWAGLRVLAAAALAVVTVVAGIFGFLPWLRVGPGWRWVTFAFFVALGFGASAGLLVLLGSLSATSLAITAGGSLIAGLILAADLEGTTPWYGSFINTFHNEAHIELVADRCTGATDCIQVCPREVLQMDGRERRAFVDRPGQCIQCGACLVQCPEDALRFRYDDGRVVEAPTIRRTRMNMLGRRTVEVADGPTIAG